MLYLTGYPGYAFFNSEGKIMGAKTVPPSDSILFAFYIEGLLENKTIEESLQIFKSEIKKTETSNKFNSFIQRRFHVNGNDRKRILELYSKYL